MKPSSLSLLLSLSMAIACGEDGRDDDSPASCRPAPSCPSGWFENNDTVCSPPYLGSGPGCNPRGDGLCYLPCETDSDCAGSGFPTCGAILVFGGDDTGEYRKVCVSETPVPACVASGGGDDVATPPSSACAACASDELCVAYYDGTCKPMQSICRKVSAEARDSILRRHESCFGKAIGDEICGMRDGQHFWGCGSPPCSEEPLISDISCYGP